ncbi:hypothetical protein EYF80_029183 [Liparis tanakae]|uniref:Uncharacterized protein n=1 Tax=Liparis tanakae TaxID=230148 RepID=A0A4Z2H6Y4_9TELE|nr:hypothetical protein EYF80_029183 [Liparis tanakae]
MQDLKYRLLSSRSIQNTVRGPSPLRGRGAVSSDPSVFFFIKSNVARQGGAGGSGRQASHNSSGITSPHGRSGGISRGGRLQRWQLRGMDDKEGPEWWYRGIEWGFLQLWLKGISRSIEWRRLSSSPSGGRRGTKVSQSKPRITGKIAGADKEVHQAGKREADGVSASLGPQRQRSVCCVLEYIGTLYSTLESTERATGCETCGSQTSTSRNMTPISASTSPRNTYEVSSTPSMSPEHFSCECSSRSSGRSLRALGAAQVRFCASTTRVPFFSHSSMSSKRQSQRHGFPASRTLRAGLRLSSARVAKGRSRRLLSLRSRSRSGGALSVPFCTERMELFCRLRLTRLGRPANKSSGRITRSLLDRSRAVSWRRFPLCRTPRTTSMKE